MPVTIDLAPILALPVADRIAIADAIWASIPDEHYPPGELSDESKATLDRRLEDLRANPDAGIPWEEVHRAALARWQK